jgi:hypothetical protein
MMMVMTAGQALSGMGEGMAADEKAEADRKADEERRARIAGAWNVRDQRLIRRGEASTESKELPKMYVNAPQSWDATAVETPTVAQRGLINQPLAV